MANIIEKIAARRKAARERRKLTPEQRQLIDRISSESFTLADRDPEDAAVIARRQLGELELDPATILLLVRVAILIYKALVALDVFAPSPETVAAICEDEKDG